MEEARARHLLARERERVEQAISQLETEIVGDDAGGMGQHPADSGTDLFQREQDAGLAAQLADELAAIEAAEGRLDDGTFGLSVVSGEPIPDERLEAVPWADRTVAEQARHERGA